MLNPWFALIAIVAFVGSVGGAYFFGRSDGRELQRSEQKTIDEIVEKVQEASIVGAATAIAKQEPKNVYIKQKVEKEIIREPVYRDCHHSPDGMQSLTAGFIAPEDQPADSGELPKTDATD